MLARPYAPEVAALRDASGSIACGIWWSWPPIDPGTGLGSRRRPPAPAPWVSVAKDFSPRLARVGAVRVQTRLAVVALWSAAALSGLVVPAAAVGRPTSRAPSVDAEHLEDAACMRCHPNETAQWRDSPHQSSYAESTFQAAIAREPRAYCRACHAPLSDRGVTVDADAAALGVACTSCHVRDGLVLASATGTGTAAAPHPITRSAALDGVDACAGCHEFPFPDTALRDRPLAMQRTVSEHAASPFAAVTCVACHMPRGDDGRRSHAFVASRDPDLVRAAVDVEVVRLGPTRVSITLRAADVGHAFPTGDLLRRVEVGAAAVRSDTEGPAARRFLARHFGDRVQSTGARLRVEIADDRVPAGGARIVELEVPEADGHRVRWWVEYQRVAHQRGRDEAAAEIDGSISIAGGTLESEPLP